MGVWSWRQGGEEAERMKVVFRVEPRGQADRRVPPFMELLCFEKEKASVTGVNYSEDRRAGR